MPILITNIKNDLITEAIKLTQAEKTILVLDKDFALDGDTYLVEYLDLQDMEGSSSQIRDIFRRALKEEEVELALETDALGLLILESAKEYEIFKKKNIFVVKNGRIEKFKACLC